MRLPRVFNWSGLAFRTRLLLGFTAVVGIVAVAASWAGVSFISRTVTAEAMVRVEMDLGTAWNAFNAETGRLQLLVGMVAQSDALRSALRGRSSAGEVTAMLQAFRRKHEIDFLTLVDRTGAAIARSWSPPGGEGPGPTDAVIVAAINGRASSGTLVLSRDRLALEGEGLAERAYIPVVYTERAGPTERAAEDRGLVLEAAIPVLDDGDRVIGVVYGGVLLNRKFSLVDRVRDAVFGNLTYRGRPIGTVTLFLGDVRIATNVMLDASTRALGTRVSEEVYRRVVEQRQRFAARAFVVNDWYLSAYDPIRDPEGHVVGIIYVGLLEKKYLEYGSTLARDYLGITFLSLVLAAGAALYFSGGLRRPIFRLVQATRELAAGNLAARVEAGACSREVAELSEAFNSMAANLERRTEEVNRASEEANRAYREAAEKNRAYLEMLGFVTHELKSPLASLVFAIGSLREHILGPLNPSQEELLKSASLSADYLQDTIANYLNLSRIEEGELRLRPAPVGLAAEVLEPVLKRLSEFISDRGMRVVRAGDVEATAVCDPDLVSSVIGNLLSNAVKYGRQGSEIRVSLKRDADGGVRFSVRNEGEGFPAEAGERLFHKFSRLISGVGDTKSGTGLGLFVSRNIIEKHGGRIWATSQPGRWAEFTFTLPLASQDAAHAGAPS